MELTQKLNLSKESNIIDIFDIHSTKIEESNTFVVEILMNKMDYDLNGYARRNFKGYLTVNTFKSLFNILQQTVHGMKHIHEAGLSHFDIKEANIMLNRDGVVKLIDFDFATENKGSLSLKRGTPLYLSPEMVRCKEDKHPRDKCDVWSFGIVVFNMLRKIQQLKKAEIVSIASKEILVDDDDNIFLLGNATSQESIDSLVDFICNTEGKNVPPDVLPYIESCSKLIKSTLQISYDDRLSVNDLYGMVDKFQNISTI